jgi:hypothetical protein
VVYSEILADEQGASAAAFWHRANTFFAQHGIGVERVLTDNGPCYRSRLWRTVLDQAGITHKRTRPYRPQTNGKIERFHRILLEEWAHIRDWTSDNQRRAAYNGFIHFYNHHRSHGSLNWATPIATLTQLLQDNLPEEQPECAIERTTRTQNAKDRPLKTGPGMFLYPFRWLLSSTVGISLV